MRQLGARVPAARQIRWRDAQNLDGSAALKIPDGWNVGSGQKGMVSCGGPEGAADLGLWVVVTTPEAQSQMWAKAPLIARYTNPAQVAVDLVPQFAAASNLPAPQNVRILEQHPVPYPNGQAAYLHWEFLQAGKKIRGLTLVVLAPTGDGQFMYYWSGISAEAASFQENFDLLWQVWQSWKVSDREYQRRMNDALRNMREAFDLYRQANDNAQRVMENANAKWSEYIRGTRHVRDERDQRVREVPTYGLDRVVEDLNREEGWNRWQIIPVEELNR
jgi:hypothetical protein